MTRPHHRARRSLVAALLTVGVLAALVSPAPAGASDDVDPLVAPGGAPPVADPATGPLPVVPYSSFTPQFAPTWPATTSGFLPGESLDYWRSNVPGIVDVRIPSTADGHQQPALWLPPTQPGPRPLLVVLHSWSAGYLQILGVPYAQWAQRNGWAMIHPNFRGRLRTPEATGSDLSVRDVVDAVDFAIARADVDPDNVYLIGFSGGGMMSLVMAGRHPDRFAGAVSWVPIHDLTRWYALRPSLRYAREIEASCGGNPLTNAAAAAECAHRSPRAHLDAARAAGVPVYIGHGLADGLVPPSHAVRAFNQLADPADRLSEGEADSIGAGVLPGYLRGRVDAPTYFRPGDPGVAFSRRSASATLVLFNGAHAGIYNPGLAWMATTMAASTPSPAVEGAIHRLYRAYFTRPPDAGGLAYWSGLYLAGRPLTAISAQFAASREFTARYGALDDAGFVELVYANVLGRTPDAGGRAYWVGLLERGWSRGSIMVGFAQSREFRAVTGTR